VRREASDDWTAHGAAGGVADRPPRGGADRRGPSARSRDVPRLRPAAGGHGPAVDDRGPLRRGGSPAPAGGGGCAARARAGPRGAAGERGPADVGAGGGPAAQPAVAEEDSRHAPVETTRVELG